MTRAASIFFLAFLVLGALIPSEPATAQENARRTLQLSLKMLGSEAPLADFSFLVLEPTSDGFERHLYETNDEGQCEVSLPHDQDVRIFALGEYLIPQSWSKIRKDRKGQCDIFVRPLKRVVVRGTVTRPDGKAASGTTITLAPLDQFEDGSLMAIESPFMTYCDPDGTFEIEVPTGYYQIWGTWSDVTTDDWLAYIALERQLDVFSDSEINLTLKLAPEVHGRVVDGRSGEPMTAIVELHSHAYLKQLSIFTGDESNWNDLGVGIFKTQARSIDPEQFTVVVRQGAVANAVNVIPDMSIEKLNNAGDLTLYAKDANKVTCKLVTADQELPISDMDIAIIPSGANKVPSYVRSALELSGYTDDKGMLDFWGLPEGRYTFYCMGGEVLIGEFALNSDTRQLTLELPIPFVFGSINYPDGTPCTCAVVEVEFELSDGRVGPARSFDAFRNRALATDKQFFVPFRWDDATYTLRFAAPEPGTTELPFHRSLDAYPYVADPIVVSPEGMTGSKREVALKASPQTPDDE